MSTPIQRSHFSTRQLRPDQRVGAWKESIAALFDISLAPQATPLDFNATVNSFLINNQIILAHCETQAQRFERSPLKVARDNLDYYLIQTCMSGSQVMRVGKRDVHYQQGDLMVIDLAEQHDAITSDFSQLTLVLPRQLLAPHLKDPDSQEGRVLRPDQGLTRLAINHMQNLYTTLGAFSVSEALQVIEPTVLLMASALNGSAATVENGGAGICASLLTAAKIKIEKHLHEELSVDSLCALLGHSRSTLYRLFEPLGGVRAYIQDRRMRRSAAMLMADTEGKLRICDIAWRWGFASEAHYSRTFRQRYGYSPREARLSGAALQEQAPGVSPVEVGDRDYEHWLAENLRVI